MAITIDGNGTITGAATLATTVASPTFTTPNIDSAQFATVSGTAPIYPCRAWVNFNGTGTVAIRSSGNVSSITDNGTGSYKVNFATSMPDADYALFGFCAGISTRTDSFSQARAKAGQNSLISCSVETGAPNTSGNTDSAEVFVSVFR